jgi:XisI protein
MDKLSKYRQIVREVLTEYADTPLAHGDVRTQTIFDREQDRYQVMDIGWSNDRRVYECVLHLDIIDEKIWVQQNMTELQIGRILMSKGVEVEDIVLGFQPPYAREYSGFAIG